MLVSNFKIASPKDIRRQACICTDDCNISKDTNVVLFKPVSVLMIVVLVKTQTSYTLLLRNGYVRGHGMLVNGQRDIAR